MVPIKQDIKDGFCCNNQSLSGIWKWKRKKANKTPKFDDQFFVDLGTCFVQIAMWLCFWYAELTEQF